MKRTWIFGIRFPTVIFRVFSFSLRPEALDVVLVIVADVDVPGLKWINRNVTFPSEYFI